MKAWQGSVGISDYHGIVSPDYLVCSVDASVESRFFHHLLRSGPLVTQFGIRSKGIRPAQWRLYWEDLAEISVSLPPLDEQRRIADFLDAETARIDALTTRRLAQVASLGELELARIGAQLCGSDRSRMGRMRTGWEWLPTIPGDWSVGPVYAYFDVQLGKMLNTDRASGEGQQPYLRNANVHWYEVSTFDLATMAFEPGERSRYGVKKGDLLVCEGGAGVAEAAVWDGQTPEVFYQKSLHRVRAISNVPVEWLMYWLRFSKAAGVFDADGNLATIPHLTGEQLAAYRIPIPCDGRRRVAVLNSEIAAIHKTQAEMTAANALLAERRRALITAAVTGQIDVTTARGADTSGLPLAGGASV
ncbi:restriction endonuclease subunit S [Sphaerisporangium sp. NPDC051017]|uniref:restriction endonuclease subunit S n=1 Tax=Sphaerisporangium sp. NPDC051017 TaxID=3154636 RepID=UPI003429286F